MYCGRALLRINQNQAPAAFVARGMGRGFAQLYIVYCIKAIQMRNWLTACSIHLSLLLIDVGARQISARL
jgi:hypothetical protein